MKPSEIFREAKCVLFEDGWVQGSYGGGTEGRCIRGAISAVADRFEIHERTGAIPASCHEILITALGLDGIDTCLPGLAFNDAPGRTFDEVIEVLDRAEKVAEQRGV